MPAVVVASSVPVRTCIGCRRRAAAAELFRVVVTPGPAGTTSARGSSPLERGAVLVSVVPDPRHRMPGRGAWLHPDPDCVALATRRRAFGRALRVPEPVDAAAVEDWVASGSAVATSSATSTYRVTHELRGSTAGDDEQ